MPCGNLSQLCPTCLDLASKCSTKLSGEYIPLNSLRQPEGTKPLALEFDTATAFDTYKGGKLIGENLRDLMEPYLTTQGAASVRRFHMWIRHYTEGEKTALRGQLAPGTDAVPVVKDARNLADVVKRMAATMTGQSPGAPAGVRFTAREPQPFDEEEDHSSLYRLRWFHELVRSQPCAPYINFAPLPLSH